MIYSCWQDWESAVKECSDCSWKGPLGEGEFYHESNMIACVDCPQCGRKLINLQTEASFEEIKELASEGSSKAKRHLAARDSD
jgi:hypothetical protein